MIRNLLFDLDGTIINSREGIFRCLSYALTEAGYPKPSESRMKKCIGPPLTTSLREVFGVPEEQLWEVIGVYRSRYDAKGIYECSLYPGIEDCLRSLKKKGYGIFLASSKNERACRKIMEHFRLTDCFDLIVGSSEDAKVETKAEVLRECMKRCADVGCENAVLIGDTHFDAEGAVEIGMGCVGVSYGFGTPEELLAAGAGVVLHSPKEVRDYFEQHTH